LVGGMRIGRKRQSCIYIHARTHALAHAHAHTRTQSHTHIHAHSHTRTHTHIHTHTHMYILTQHAQNAKHVIANISNTMNVVKNAHDTITYL